MMISLRRILWMAVLCSLWMTIDGAIRPDRHRVFAQGNDQRRMFVAVESAVQNYLEEVGRRESKRKDVIDSMTPLHWVASNISSGRNSMEQWKSNHPFGGMIRLVVSWKIEPTTDTLQAMEETRGSALTSEMLYKLKHLTTAANYSLRLTPRGWLMRDPDTTATGSTVYPYSRYHSKGFLLNAVDYITTVTGNATMQNLQTKHEMRAMEFQTLEPWDILNTNRNGRVEFKWGRCGIVRLPENTTFHIYEEETEDDGISSGRLEYGRMWLQCYATEGQAYKLECSTLQLRFVEANFTLARDKERTELHVLSGVVWVIDGNSDQRVTAGSVLVAGSGITEQKASNPTWAQASNFEFDIPMVDGKYNYCTADKARVHLYGMLESNPDQEHFVIDGRLDTAVKFGTHRKRKEVIVALPESALINEVRIYAGSGGPEVMTTEYVLELSQDGTFKGEEITVKRGFFGGIETLGKPNHKRRVEIAPQHVRYIRYRVTHDSNSDSSLYELQALGPRPEHPYEWMRTPWLFPVNLTERFTDKLLLKTRKQTDKSATTLVLDGRTEGGRVVVSGNGGALRFDLGEDQACNALLLAAKIISKKGGRKDQTFAIDVSPTGRFRGEEKRLVASSLQTASRSAQLLMEFNPVLARYWQVQFVNNSKQDIAVFEVQFLAPLYTPGESGEALPFRASSPFASDSGHLLSGPVGQLTIAHTDCTDANATLEAALDGNTQSATDVTGKNSIALFQLEGLRQVHSISIYASPGSIEHKEVTNFVLESSATGEFQGEETILATGVFEGIASEEQFDYFHKFNLHKPVDMQYFRIRITYTSGEAYRLHEVALEGASE